MAARKQAAKKAGAPAPAAPPEEAPKEDPLDDDAPAYVHFDAEKSAVKESAAKAREAVKLAYEAASKEL